MHSSHNPSETAPISTGASAAAFETEPAERDEREATSRWRWRVVDIVVASVIGIASGVIFWGWDAIANVPMTVLAPVPGLSGLVNGMWLFAGPLAALIVRKPGAAIYAELVAAVLEVLLGGVFSNGAIPIGLLQGLGAELGFAVFAYRRWGVDSALLSGGLAGLACALYSFVVNFAGIDPAGNYGIVYFITSIISGMLIAGLLMWGLHRRIARTGALSRFASGREVSRDV
ncbi:MAG: ECF transporter S component [Bifidobacterium subtile]|nr:ECF transporter S component [Bifidobacterium subtile]MCI1241166.1 ECF transporter S component [Bifidobacterium subtile]MCI1258219.1 ECF transporter S component [Bifidobacterium subtile]